MQMDIHLFSHIKDSDYAMSVRFSLEKIEYTEHKRTLCAIAVVRFYLHTSLKLERRNIVFSFDRFGDVCAPCKILADTAEYARIVDNSLKFQRVEEDLGKAVCKIIGLAVNKHYAN